MKPHANTEALSVVVYGSDGNTWVLRKGRRGSMSLKVKEITDIADERFWTVDKVPDHVTGTMQELNDAYNQYLFMKESGYPLTADQWLDTADQLAGRASELIARVGNPKVVYIQETNRPAWATVLENAYGRRMRRPRKPRVRAIIQSHQLVLFG